MTRIALFALFLSAALTGCADGNFDLETEHARYITVTSASETIEEFKTALEADDMHCSIYECESDRSHCTDIIAGKKDDASTIVNVRIDTQMTPTRRLHCRGPEHTTHVLGLVGCKISLTAIEVDRQIAAMQSEMWCTGL